MRLLPIASLGLAALTLAGCGGLTFSKGWDEGDALHFYDVKPYLLVSVTKDCTSSASVVSLPGGKRSVRFRSGYGTADLSVSLQNGMVTSVGQKTDSKVPETISAATGLIGQLKTLNVVPGAAPEGCKPAAKLYPIDDGAIDTAHPVEVDWASAK